MPPAALWDAWETFVRSNWPCSIAFLQRELKIPERAARKFRKFAAAEIEKIKKDDISFTQVSETELEVESKSGRIKTLEQLLEVSEVDLTLWEVVKHKLNSWEIGAKNHESKIVTETLYQVTAYLERKFVSQDFQNLIYVLPPPPIEPIVSSVKKALVIPDIQLGYRWEENLTYLNPIHDRLAMDVVWQIVEREQPDEIILIGDLLDHAPFAQKFKTAPDMKFTTQAAFAEIYYWLAELRRICPHAKIRWIEGNHEARLRGAVQTAIEEFFYIQNASGHSPVSHSELLQLDTLKVQILEPYNAEYWLWGSIRVQHGRAVSTEKIMNSLQMHSEIQGHTHRLAINSKTLHAPQGARVIQSMQPGCLCKVTGNIPPAYQERNDWQQGFGMVYQVENQISMQVYSITDGSCIFDGAKIRGNDRSKEIALATKWKQLAK